MIIVWTSEKEDLYSKREFDSVDEFEESLLLGEFKPGQNIEITKALKVALISDDLDNVLVEVAKK